MTDVQQKNLYAAEEDNEQSSFNFQKLYSILILNWKWFVLSIIIYRTFTIFYPYFT